MVSYYNNLAQATEVVKTRRSSLDNIAKKLPKKIELDVDILENQINEVEHHLNKYVSYVKEDHQEFQTVLFTLLSKLVQISDKESFEKKQSLSNRVQNLFKYLNQRLPNNSNTRAATLNVSDAQTSKPLIVQQKSRLARNLQNIIKEVGDYQVYEKARHQRLQTTLMNMLMELSTIEGLTEEEYDQGIQKINELLKNLVDKFPEKPSQQLSMSTDKDLDKIEEAIESLDVQLTNYTTYSKEEQKWFANTLYHFLTKLTKYKNARGKKLIDSVQRLLNELNAKLPGATVEPTQKGENIFQTEPRTDNNANERPSVWKLKNIYESQSQDFAYTESNMSLWRAQQNIKGKYLSRNIGFSKSTPDLDKEVE